MLRVFHVVYEDLNANGATDITVCPVFRGIFDREEDAKSFIDLQSGFSNYGTNPKKPVCDWKNRPMFYERPICIDSDIVNCILSFFGKMQEKYCAL